MAFQSIIMVVNLKEEEVILTDSTSKTAVTIISHGSEIKVT